MVLMIAVVDGVHVHHAAMFAGGKPQNMIGKGQLLSFCSDTPESLANTISQMPYSLLVGRQRELLFLTSEATFAMVNFVHSLAYRAGHEL